MTTTCICDKPERVVFHFNKAHNTDPINIPAWVVKCKGNTYYVHSMSSKVGFSTKSTPDSEHTKASLQFKGKLTIVENDDGTNEAIID
jgi:hypothetical protein